MRFQAVIFDMDGVLIDSEPLYHRSDAQLFKSLGIEMTKQDADGLLGVDVKYGARGVLKRHPELKLTVDELCEQYRKSLFGALKNDGLTLNPGLDYWLSELRAAGIKLAIASSSTDEMVEYVVSRFSLDRYVSAVITGGMVAVAKPYPDIFLKAAEALNALPSECVVIEDSPNGIKAAKAANMTCIVYTANNIHKSDISNADYGIEKFNRDSLELILSR